MMMMMMTTTTTMTMMIMTLMMMASTAMTSMFAVVAWVPPQHITTHQRRCLIDTTTSSLALKRRRRPQQQQPRFLQTAITTKTTKTRTTTTTQLQGWISDLFNPYDSKIPPELVDEIYKAEANTQAAQNRGQRVFLYTCLAIVGIVMATFNGFLTELRAEEAAASASASIAAGSVVVETVHNNNLNALVSNGFGWVLENPVWTFLFTNKIGGGIALLTGGGFGLLAEAELDSKRINAEKIYEELERRRQLKQEKQPKSNGSSSSSNNNKKKQRKRSGKETKRLSALSEVVMPSSTETMDASTTDMLQAATSNDSNGPTTEVVTSASATAEKQEPDDSRATTGEMKKGLLDQMKNLYERADSMAASQALLLNKKLEDAGVVEKITDETGLKVIGREEAKKLETNKDTNGKNDEQP
jgi:translation initiation factor 2 beta subunit (eIF-2beta)/eIF-5